MQNNTTKDFLSTLKPAELRDLGMGHGVLRARCKMDIAIIFAVLDATTVMPDDDDAQQWPADLWLLGLELGQLHLLDGHMAALAHLVDWWATDLGSPSSLERTVATIQDAVWGLPKSALLPHLADLVGAYTAACEADAAAHVSTAAQLFL